jgi:ligand-binding sensor domain-containing protein
MIKHVHVYALVVFVFCTSCKEQAKTELQKESPTSSTGQSKLIKTQRSGVGDNVHGSIQDRKGNLWFATTSNGVYRYDGKSFKNFTSKDGLNSNGIFSILEDKKGDIWFGTTVGLSHFDGKTFRPIPLSLTVANYVYPSDPSTNVLVFHSIEDKSGKLWFGTDKDVYCYDGKAFTVFLDNPSVINTTGLNLRSVDRILEDKHGNIWFTTKTEGVCRYDGKSIVNFKPDGELWFYGLLEDRNGNIWVGTRYNGVYRYDGKTFTKMLQNGRFDSYTVLSILQDKSGNIWFGTEAGDESKRETEGGVWRYDGKTFENFSTEDGLSHNAVWSILEDSAGNFWVGTRNTDLCRFDGKTFTCFSK